MGRVLYICKYFLKLFVSILRFRFVLEVRGYYGHRAKWQAGIFNISKQSECDCHVELREAHSSSQLVPEIRLTKTVSSKQ